MPLSQIPSLLVFLDHSPDFGLNFRSFYLNRFNLYERACPVKFYPACHIGKDDCIRVQSLPHLPYKEALSYQGKMFTPWNFVIPLGGNIFHWGAMKEFVKTPFLKRECGFFLLIHQY